MGWTEAPWHIAVQLVQFIRSVPFVQHVGDCALGLHQRWSLHALCVLPLAIAPFQRLLHRSGTVCRSQSGHRRRYKFSAADWKPNFLSGLTSVLSLTKNVSLHWLLLLHCLDLLLRVLVVLGLNATLKFIRRSSLSSSMKLAFYFDSVQFCCVVHPFRTKIFVQFILAHFLLLCRRFERQTNVWRVFAGIWPITACSSSIRTWFDCWESTRP